MAAIELAQKISTYTFARIRLITTILTACNDISNIVIELSEREIYNDIRSRTNDTAGYETSYDTKEVEQNVCDYPPQIGTGETEEITVFSESGDTEVTWIGITRQSAVGETIRDNTEEACTALGGEWRMTKYGFSICTFGDMSEYLEVTPIGQTTNSFTFEVTNNHSTLDLRYTVRVAYRYLAIREILIRETDDTSIEKYGRRVMNLTWELGMSIASVQQMVESYLDKYAEPIPLLTITVLGSDARLATFILNSKVNDVIRIEDDDMNINHDFWINQLAPIHRVDGILECDYVLEQVRTIEQVSFFILYTSMLDAGDVLAP